MSPVTIGVAIPVPEPLAAQVRQVRASVGDDAAERIPTHVTLVPPTAVAPEDLPGIGEHLASVAAGVPAFPIVLAGTGSFRPVTDVAFLRLRVGAEQCDTLQARLRTGPLVRPLEFPYHPHVTLAHNVADAALEEVSARMAGVRASFVVDRVVLYVEHPGQPWHPVGSFPLAVASRGS